MKIINEAQIKHEYYFNKQIMKIHFSFKDENQKKFIFHLKNKLLGICMFLSKTNNMHIYPKHKQSP